MYTYSTSLCAISIRGLNPLQLPLPCLPIQQCPSVLRAGLDLANVASPVGQPKMISQGQSRKPKYSRIESGHSIPGRLGIE